MGKRCLSGHVIPHWIIWVPNADYDRYSEEIEGRTDSEGRYHPHEAEERRRPQTEQKPVGVLGPRHHRSGGPRRHEGPQATHTAFRSCHHDRIEEKPDKKLQKEVDRLEDELGLNKDRYKSLADEMDSTFAELAGY